MDVRHRVEVNDMDFDFGGIGEFTTTDENIEIKKTKDFDRMWKIGFGGSIPFKSVYEGVLYFGSCDRNFLCS